MKKSKLILFSIISILFLSGCGSVKIDKALENMKSAKSYTMNVELSGSVSKSKIEQDNVNSITRQTSSVVTNGVSKEMIVYSQISDNKLISYTKGMFGDNWIYNEMDISSVDLGDESKALDLDSSKFTKVKSNEKGIYKYKADLSDTQDGEGVQCYVYTDGKYVTKIEMLSDDFNEVITFSNINSTFVTIPDDVKENAKKIGEIDFSNIDLSQYSDIDVAGINDETIKEQFEKAKEYMNSDEFKNQMQKAQDYMNSDEFKNQMQKAQDYMNSDEFKDQMQKAQDYMNSEEYQRQMQEAQERARAFLNR